MKKVLIITYYWPPSGGGGVQRWLKFSKYLPECGWKPIIYTPEIQQAAATDPTLLRDISPDLEVVRRPIWEPYSLYKAIAGLKSDENVGAGFASEKKSNRYVETISNIIRSNFFIPDARMFWISPSVRFLKKYIADNDIKAVITTGPPHSMHLIGLGLKKALNIHWIADFRDPWTAIDFYDQLKLSAWADKKHHRLEREVLTHADLVICVSNSNRNQFLQNASTHIEVITNGYDPDDIPDAIVSPDKKFTLAHIGTFMANRNPELLWQVLTEIIEENVDFKADFELHLTGKTDKVILEYIESVGLMPFVRKRNQVSHDEAIILQRQAQVLLLLVNKTGDSKGMVTGKIFEYLVSGRPILAIGPTDGDLADILKETFTGVISDFEDKLTLKEHIINYYRQYKSGTTQVQSMNTEKYSRRYLTGALAKYLNQIVQ